jgi:hypothetical protein
MSVFIARDNNGLLQERLTPPPGGSQPVKLIQRSQFGQYNEIVGLIGVAVRRVGEINRAKSIKEDIFCS